MLERPLRTTTVGSMPSPGWLEFAAANLEAFGADDRAELQDDAVRVAVWEQLTAGLDAITDGEPTRLDFNLSFYGHLEGIALEEAPGRKFGPPAHDQRGKHRIVGELTAPHGLGVVEEYRRLVRIAEPLLSGTYRPALKASVPGPYTLAGRLIPNERYHDRWQVAEALLPIVGRELSTLVEAGCREIAVDEPSMSCYGDREDPRRFVDLFARTVAGVRGRCRLTTHLCFGNYKGRAVGRRRYAPLFPAFLDLPVEEIHVEMASREFAELEIVGRIAERCDAAVGVVDVKSYYIEPPEEIAARVRACLKFAPPERLAFAPDCGLSQTARWASTKKLANLVAGVKLVRKELGLD
jgi:5-methyltetrahydropteroyltriglutamate--homocysteine methyltransferase